MRRLVAAAVSILVTLAVLYVIGSAGSSRHAKATTSSPLYAARQAARTSTRPTATQTSAAHTTTVITATWTDCRWRQYRDGAIASDPACAPGKLNPTATRNIAQTICNPTSVAAASRIQPPPTTLDKLLIEYQLPGNPLTTRWRE